MIPTILIISWFAPLLALFLSHLSQRDPKLFTTKKAADANKAFLIQIWDFETLYIIQLVFQVSSLSISSFQDYVARSVCFSQEASRDSDLANFIWVSCGLSGFTKVTRAFIYGNCSWWVKYIFPQRGGWGGLLTGQACFWGSQTWLDEEAMWPPPSKHGCSRRSVGGGLPKFGRGCTPVHPHGYRPALKSNNQFLFLYLRMWTLFQINSILIPKRTSKRGGTG